MKTDDAIELADEWARHLTPHVQDGWRVACKTLADEVRLLRAEREALRKQEPVARARWVENGCALEIVGLTNSGEFIALSAAKRKPPRFDLFAAPVPPATSAVPDVSKLEPHSRVPDDYRNQAAGYRAGWNDCRGAHRAFVDHVSVLPAESAAPDGFREGVEAVARLIDSKAEVYAIRFGRDDMGGLSFGQGQSGEIKMDHYTGLLELADEVRAVFGAAPKPKCSTCNDHGMVGGPSYYAPDEGGEPCPDCAAPKPEVK